MVTLLPIEPRNEQHGILIVEAFSRFFINRGGQSDGRGSGACHGYGNIIGDGGGCGCGVGDLNGDGNGDGSGYGEGWGDGRGSGDVWGNGGKPPEEWLVK